jgi:hypothetical protein
VSHEKGFDFLAGLRAALRQDPDVIMVGEIRNQDTATNGQYFGYLNLKNHRYKLLLLPEGVVRKDANQ